MEKERHGKYRTWATAPRWAGLETFLRNLAFQLELPIVMDKSTSLLTVTIRFEVTGTESKLNVFKHTLEKSMKEYNT